MIAWPLGHIQVCGQVFMLSHEVGVAGPAHLPVWKLILCRVLATVFISHLRVGVSSQWLSQFTPHLHTTELSFCSAQHNTCSTRLKTRSRFPRRTPWSSFSLQPRLSNSSIRTGYVDTFSSSRGNLCKHQPASCGTMALILVYGHCPNSPSHMGN